MKRENKLNTRQWDFYNYLKEQALEDENKWISKLEISLWVDGYDLKLDVKSHDECSLMNSDRIAINSSLETDKIILIKDNCFKIANKEEAEELVDDLYKQAMRLLGRMSLIKHKIDRDNQGKLISNQGQPIDKYSKARDFYETFIGEDNNE